MGAYGAILTLVLSPTLAACGNSDSSQSETESNGELDKVSFRLDWTPGGHHTPFYYGVAKGFYAEQGIDLQIENGQGGNVTQQSVGTGKDEFGWSALGAFPNAVSQQELPIVSIAEVFHRDGFGLLIPDDSSINTWDDVAGATILVDPAGSESPLLKAALDKQGLTDSVKLNNVHSNGVAVYASGEGDALATALWFDEPNVRDRRPSRGLTFADAGIPLPGTGIFTSHDMIESNPDLVKRFMAATTKSWEEARQHEDDAVSALIEKNPTLDAEVIAMQFANILQYLDGPDSQDHPFGYNSPDDWQLAHEVNVEYLECDACVGQDPSRYYTNEFLSE